MLYQDARRRGAEDARAEKKQREQAAKQQQAAIEELKREAGA